MYLEDEEMAIIKLGRDIRVRRILDDAFVDTIIQKLKLSLDQNEKGGYDHFMIKEIHEQPKAIIDTFRGRMLVDKGIIKMSGIDNNIKKFLNTKRIVIVA